MSVSRVDLIIAARDVLNASWQITDGRVVPETEDVVLRNGAVRVDATYAYADMAGSSALAQLCYPQVTAKIIRAYVGTATRVLRGYGGEIRSFDGDRVMAIFIGANKNTNAVRAALALNWAVTEMLRPEIAEAWPDVQPHWSLKHGVGIDTGRALIVRGGVRGSNDLISVGGAPNVAAKLSELRGVDQLFITEAVYADMSDDVARNGDTGSYREPMWRQSAPVRVGGNTVRVKSSSWYWSP